MHTGPGMTNPWGPPERAAAREDAIFDQFEVEIKRADQRFVTERHKDRYLDKQFGSRAVRAAIMAAFTRRQPVKE